MKYLDIKGKAVVDKGARVLGRVESVVINPERMRVCGILVSTTLISTKYFLIPFKGVKFYKEFIEFDGRLFRVKRSILVKNRDIVLQNHLEKEVFDFKGRKLGKLIDLFIESNSGRIIALTISGGFFEDLFSGRKILPLEGNSTFKYSNIVVKECNFEFRNEILLKKFLRE